MSEFFKFEVPVEKVMLCAGFETKTNYTVVHTDRRGHGLLYNTKRPRTYHFDGYGDFEVKVGDILYFPKHTDYHGKLLPDSYCDVINFDLVQDVRFEPFVMTPKNPSAIEELFKSAERAFNKGETLRCTAKLYEIFAIIKKERDSEYAPSARVRIIEPAIKRINETVAERAPTVGELAALCEISEGYFRSLFLSALGQSPTEYATTVKINRAKELIRSGLCSISEAARSVGFEDIAYFSRVFRKIVGISPREYKNSSV